MLKLDTDQSIRIVYHQNSLSFQTIDLEKSSFRSITCSKSNDFILNKDGSLYTFTAGADSDGASVISLTEFPVENFKDVVHLCCGDNHVLGITSKSKLISWGSNVRGQLGRETSENSNDAFVCNYSAFVDGPLTNMRIAKVACGSLHSLALSKNGQLFSWGSNNNGQLGLSADVDIATSPRHISSLHGLPLHAIAAGGYHCIAVTVSGAVFAWGSNLYGQLGIGRDQPKATAPIPVRELRKHMITYLSCGENHTAVLSEINGKVFTFGRNHAYQLGHSDNNNYNRPYEPSLPEDTCVFKVSCGGAHTVFLAKEECSNVLFIAGANDSKIVKKTLVTNSGDIGLVSSGSNSCIVTLSSSCDLMDAEMFSISRLNDATISRLFKPTSQGYLLEEDKKLAAEVFSSLNCLNASFLLPEPRHMCCSNSNCGLDMDLITQTSEAMTNNCDQQMGQIIFNSLVKSILPCLKKDVPDYEALRVYLILVQLGMNPLHFQELIMPFANAINNLSDVGSKALHSWWKNMGSTHFLRQLNVFKEAILYIVSKENIPGNIYADALNVFLNTFDSIYTVHQTASNSVAVQEFYIPQLIEKEKHSPNLQNLHDKCPFILNIGDKFQMLRTKFKISMMHFVSIEKPMVPDPILCAMILADNPFILEIDRNNLISSAYKAIDNASITDLKRPLRVKFINEEAIDGGAIRKEFFYIFMKEIIKPEEGVFEVKRASQMAWFKPNPQALDIEKFYFVGVVCGLSVYNEIEMYLNLPKVFYKKLLNGKLDETDLLEIEPEILSGLKCLLSSTEDNLSEEFGLSFQISDDVFGDVDLIENGSKVEVTQANKHSFVAAYTDFLLNKKFRNEFAAFKMGFFTVCDKKLLQKIHWAEMYEILSTIPLVDLSSLESSATYEGIYNAKHPTIKFFWEAAHALSEKEKIRLLYFLTGTERMSVQGMKSLKLVIVPKTELNESYLPVAITCSNHLLLPIYSTFDILFEKLKLAITECEGFGMI